LKYGDRGKAVRSFIIIKKQREVKKVKRGKKYIEKAKILELSSSDKFFGI